MFYPNYDDYMRDVFYFNGLSNPNSMYYMNNAVNTASLNNTSLNTLYPSIYRIINPVVQKVVNGNNYQFINEETVNNMVDGVYGIVEGDINNVEKEANQDTRKNTTMVNSSQNSTVSTANTNNFNNNLLRDLIRILIIKELLNRNNVRRFPFTYGGGMPYYMNGQMSPYMVN